MSAAAHPQELRRVVIKEELVKLTGHWRAALILNQFLYWLQRHRQYDQFLLEEQARNPDMQVPATHGWIYKSAKELQHELMIDVSEVTLRRDIKLLIERGWLAERHNPNHTWDRELQYRPDIRRIQQDLQALGYALEGYPLLMEDATFTMKNASFTMKNASNTMKDRSFTSEPSILHHEGSILHGEGAIPKSTSEIPPETTSKEDDDVVAVLEGLGLTHEQASMAQRNYTLTTAEADLWATWKRGLDPRKRPDSIFAGLIRKQRLPPGVTVSNVAPASPETAEAKQAMVIPTPDGTRTLSVDACWQQVLDDVAGRVAKDDYATWLKPTRLLEIDDGRAIVSVSNIFVQQEVERRYLEMLQDALQGVLGQRIDVDVVIGGIDSG